MKCIKIVLKSEFKNSVVLNGIVKKLDTPGINVGTCTIQRCLNKN